MKIAMIGTGYVGLVTGVCLSHLGHTVTCVDMNSEKIAHIKKGNIPIYESRLSRLVTQCVEQNRLFFTDDFTDGIKDCNAIFICVGTPSNKDGSADLSAVYTVAEKIAKTATRKVAVVNKSTVPIGTAHTVQKILHNITPNIQFSVVSNPEFLREGVAIDDFLNPDRIVIGADDDFGADIMQQIYAPLTSQGVNLMITDTKSAEMIKYATNAFLATKITFANDLADLCEKVGSNITDVTKGFGMDTRIGHKFLHPGPGYGGSCFPKDTQALVHTSNTHNVPMDIIRTVVKVNADRKNRMAQKILHHMGHTKKKVTILGLTFKSNTNDMRESPALTIIPLLQNAGLHISAYDPQGIQNAKSHMPNIEYCHTIHHACKDTDAIVILTEWNAFSVLDFEKLSYTVRCKTIIDLRNLYDLDRMQHIRNTYGFTYHSIGRKSIM